MSDFLGPGDVRFSHRIAVETAAFDLVAEDRAEETDDVSYRRRGEAGGPLLRYPLLNQFGRDLNELMIPKGGEEMEVDT